MFAFIGAWEFHNWRFFSMIKENCLQLVSSRGPFLAELSIDARGF